MQYATLTTALLLAGSAVAAPGTAMRAARAAKRSTGIHKGNPLIQSELVGAHSEIANVEYSNNWAGAVLIGSGFTSVTGTFTVPTPTSDGSGSAWVGIDGDTCGSAILQTGIDWTLSNGQVTYDAWYEWYPDYAYDFTGIDLNAGDTITVTVEATGASSGTATIENQSTGQSVNHSWNGDVQGQLCQTNAEWIVEDFESGGSLVGFANFGSVTFTGASATSSDGNVDTSGATIMDIESGSTVLTDCSASGSTVSCSYV